MPKWIRTAPASELVTARERSGAVVGWSWEIKRTGGEKRHVRVEIEVDAGCRVTDLPETARRPIRSRGATAVDAILDVDDPPERIVVSTLGVHAP